ncbi:uncharacterized protein LOC135961482 [Calliphora vicina]|uniref:uncharacterized protein LOC135961482 n=1 Tax=Calliphora vicina TaxID=7373 RepID=UPI00325AAA96
MMPFQNIALLLGIIISSLNQNFVNNQIIPYPEPGNRNLLAADLFHTLVEKQSSENVIFSPLSAETALTLLFNGAKGKTAENLQKVLRLKTLNETRIALDFGKFLKSILQSQANTSDSALFLANRIYAADGLKISEEFNKNAIENVNGLADNVNFAEGKLAADEINHWLAKQTQNNIKNLLSEDDIDALTNIVLVNGLYFKGIWRQSFNKEATKPSEFQLNLKEKTQVDMMHIQGTFNYADLPVLSATALELPYNSNNLSLLILLPNEIEGVEQLEVKLKTLEFNYIPSRLAAKKVCACIPKFRIEHELDLRKALEKSEILPYPDAGNHNLLAADLFHNVVDAKSSENIFFSPLSAETALTLLFAGAKGKTAENLQRVLRLKALDETGIAQDFGAFLKTVLKSQANTKTSDSALYLANRIYAADGLKISEEFNKNAIENFNGFAENVNFAEGKLAADKINNWLAQQTQDKIKNLLSEDDIDALTNIVLVNALYFKGTWKQSFNKEATKPSDFQLNLKETIPVDMMHIQGTFNYADMPELAATALELPYNSNNLSLLVILPNEIEGLEQLEIKLKNVEFNYIPSRLAAKNLCACIPKFRIEHELNLRKALENLDLSLIFSENADFGGIFGSSPNQFISAIKQKSVFEIDELGSLPAAKIENCQKDQLFNANHPFIYGVRSNAAVYFAGHMANHKKSPYLNKPVQKKNKETELTNFGATMTSLKSTVLILGLSLLQIINPTTAATIAPLQKSPNHNLFAADLFNVMVEGKSTQNIIYSPASIQTCMALTFIGAEGETAEEMRNVLRLGDGDKVQVAENFREFLKTAPTAADNLTDTTEVPLLKIASRLYVNEQLNVSAEFNEISQKYFDTQAEQVNFTDNKAVVEKINSWIEEKTESKIKDIMQEDAVNADTNAVVVNAIYFKAKWLNPFSQSSTSTSQFRLNLNDSMEAEIMYIEEYFGYVDLPELEASALEMPYENSDISMVIILPNEIEGLEKLEQNLRVMDLNEIIDKMTIRKAHVYVPKFRVEFDVDLKEPLEKLGLSTTFSSSANFKGLFSTPELQSISEVKHKAFLDVNEAGSEAAAATFTTLTTLSAVFDEPTFRADHPFIFAIRSKSAVYFAGHMAKI